MLRYTVLFVAFTAGVVAAAPASIVRLPGDARALRYEASLTVRPAEAVFEGTIAIDVSMRRGTTTLWLNGTDLEVIEASVGGRTVKTQTEGNEFIGLTLAQPATRGRSRVKIRYRGKVREDFNAGAFRRKSADGDWYVYTTFTAIDARRVFPCFDQPDVKTPWQLTVTVPEGDIALANTPLVRERAEADGMKSFVFAETLALPAEIVAFAVGPFDLLDAGVAGRNRTPMRVAAPKGRAEEGRLAGEIARTVLPRLEEYTGMVHPYPKLDHLALLEGAFGGVENAGLIQYLGRLLLVGREQEPARREDLEGLMAHEMAHQWLGDLVTQSTWKDVWLSEGLTTWLGQKTADLSLPEERRGLRRAASRESALHTDGGEKARAVRMDLPTRADMKKVYGGLVYSKGASFAVMLEGWLGEAAFQRSVRRYLREHAYKNASTADFLGAVRAETGQDVSAMAGLLDRLGAPEITAAVVCEGGRAKLALEQRRYATAGHAGDKEIPWTLPVCARTDGGTDCVVMAAATAELPLRSAGGCPAWVMPNAGGLGYYRLRMALPALAETTRAADRLTPVERVTLAGDTAAMVTAGVLQAADALPVLESLTRYEETRTVTREALMTIGRIAGEPLREAYGRYAKEKFGVEISADAAGADEEALPPIHAAGLRQFLDSYLRK